MMATLPIPGAPYRDPIYDGASDPVILWNREENCWWLLYTQRRASDITIEYSSIHGSKIGVASSVDGKRWLYRGTLEGLDFEPGHNTFWAPEVIYAQGKYHMYVSYIIGVPTDWEWPRHIVHYTADNLWRWRFEEILPLSSDKVIDACVYEVTPGKYKMWYKDEAHESHTYTAMSDDLYSWQAGDAEITDCAHEGPNVFELGMKKWMITDCWDGLAVYSSEDFTHWRRQECNLLRDGGDLGHHADVLVSGEKAYIFYFTHQANQPNTIVQRAELTIRDGRICCD